MNFVHSGDLSEREMGKDVVARRSMPTDADVNARSQVKTVVRARVGQVQGYSTSFIHQNGGYTRHLPLASEVL